MLFRSSSELWGQDGLSIMPPSAADLALMVTTICERVCKLLGRRGLIGEANHDSNEADTTPDALAACRKVSLSRGRFERLDERGRAQQQLFPDDEPWMRRKKDDRWTADLKGFSLNAGVSFSALDRRGREQLVRYCTRPPLAMERLSVLRDGSVAYKLKYASKRRSHRIMVPQTICYPAGWDSLSVDQDHAQGPPTLR